MKSRRTEVEPASVPAKAKQAGKVRFRWSWVEPSVWTERMLTILEEGVKGGKWFSLIDKVYNERNLKAAFRRVQKNEGSAGVDHQTIEMFAKNRGQNLKRLSELLRENTYEPREVKRVWIEKPGKRTEKRPLGIPTVRDRVVQTALRNVLEPIFEIGFAEHSYGFRPNVGCKDALRRVVWLLENGYVWVVDADFRSYFDRIPRDRLLNRIKETIADGRVLDLIEKYLTQSVMDRMKTWTPESGTPQGAVISPLLSNIYLDPLDHLMATSGYEMVRYADDFVVLCRSEAEAQRALGMVQLWTEVEGLELHPEKTHLVDASQRGGFDFLGYHFEQGTYWPRKKSLAKLKDTLRAKTRRTNGHSLETIISSINLVLRGWFEYYKHSNKYTYPPIDAWIRMRLRSILRKRQGTKGRGRGRDHHRWPNAFFAEHGLLSLVAVAGYEERRDSGG